jgi:hypothetical protein
MPKSRTFPLEHRPVHGRESASSRWICTGAIRHKHTGGSHRERSRKGQSNPQDNSAGVRSRHTLPLTGELAIWIENKYFRRACFDSFGLYFNLCLGWRRNRPNFERFYGRLRARV